MAARPLSENEQRSSYAAQESPKPDHWEDLMAEQLVDDMV